MPFSAGDATFSSFVGEMEGVDGFDVMDAAGPGVEGAARISMTGMGVAQTLHRSKANGLRNVHAPHIHSLLDATAGGGAPPRGSKSAKNDRSSLIVITFFLSTQFKTSSQMGTLLCRAGCVADRQLLIRFSQRFYFHFPGATRNKAWGSRQEKDGEDEEHKSKLR